jgi:hypothetical protein
MAFESTSSKCYRYMSRLAILLPECSVAMHNRIRMSLSPPNFLYWNIAGAKHTHLQVVGVRMPPMHAANAANKQPVAAARQLQDIRDSVPIM